MDVCIYFGWNGFIAIVWHILFHAISKYLSFPLLTVVIQLNAGYWCNFYWVKNAVPYPLILILSIWSISTALWEASAPGPASDPQSPLRPIGNPLWLASASTTSIIFIAMRFGSNLHVDDVQLIWCVMMGKLQEVDPFPRLIGGQGHSGIVCKNYPRFEQWRWRWLTKGGSPDEKDMVGHEVGHVVRREVSQTMWWEKRYHQSITNDPVLQNGQKAGQ